MSIMWIKNQSKWIIVGATVLVALGLILMDRTGASRQGYGLSGDNIGSVDGEDIQINAFQQELQNYVRSEEARTGKAPEGQQLAQMRENLFQMKVQNVLFAKVFKDYQLQPSVEEMQDYLLTHPQEIGYSLARYEGPDRVPAFLRDSTLDPSRLQNWLAQDSVYDRLGMMAMEEQLKTSVIPQLQLQTLLKAQVHRTDLEEAFALEKTENLGKIQFYHIGVDAFQVSKDKFNEGDLKAYFESQPDSFYHPEEAAQLRYVRIAIQPSAKDSSLMHDFAVELKERAQHGESFADLAKSYSGDAGSADSGGRLGGFQPASNWVPEFAAAGFRLAAGEISDPVLTPYGYHIILSNGKKTEGGIEKANLSHILLKITAGTETVDSITDLAEKVKSEAEKSGLETAAKPLGLSVLKTPVFQKGSPSPLGAVYVVGVQSFAFGKNEKKAKVSDVLQNEEGIYVFERDAHFSKGRDFGRSKDHIADILVLNEKKALARKELERLYPSITALAQPFPAKLDLAALDSTQLVSAETYAPEFGTGSPDLIRCFRQKQGEWGPVRSTALGGAVVARLVEWHPIDAAAKPTRAHQAIVQGGDGPLLNDLYQKWTTDLVKMSKVENHLDRVYRN